MGNSSTLLCLITNFLTQAYIAQLMSKVLHKFKFGLRLSIICKEIVNDGNQYLHLLHTYIDVFFLVGQIIQFVYLFVDLRMQLVYIRFVAGQLALDIFTHHIFGCITHKLRLSRLINTKTQTIYLEQRKYCFYLELKKSNCSCLSVMTLLEADLHFSRVLILANAPV